MNKNQTSQNTYSNQGFSCATIFFRIQLSPPVLLHYDECSLLWLEFFAMINMRKTKVVRIIKMENVCSIEHLCDGCVALQVFNAYECWDDSANSYTLLHLHAPKTSILLSFLPLIWALTVMNHVSWTHRYRNGPKILWTTGMSLKHFCTVLGCMSLEDKDQTCAFKI